MEVSKELMLRRHDQIKPFIHNTPILTSSFFNNLTGANLYFKCENFQKMGAFKMRGAASAISVLTEDQKIKGVVTHSSGNFAQAVALAASKMNIRSKIVMPENAPSVKKNAVKDYGGEVIECESTAIAREKMAAKIVQDSGATFLHPSNDLDVILGQATSVIELLNDHADLDYILTPVGGGGLIAGACLAGYHFGNNCKVIGAEPSVADDAYRSLQIGEIQMNNSATLTVADGLRTFLGDINFPIIQKHIDQILLVDEDEIISAMRMVWERMKIIIEPSCAVPVAAVIKNQSLFENKKVGIVITGGNVDLGNLPF